MASAVVRLGPLMAMPAVLREFGCEPEAILDAVGLTPAHFEDADYTISYALADKLLAQCTRATGCEHFGLLVGSRAGGSHLGVAGYMLHCAPNVGTALRDLTYHLDLHDRGGIPTLTTSGNVTLFGYAIHYNEVTVPAQIHDLAVAVGCNIMRKLCGEHWNPNEVLLSRRQPTDTAPYQRFFRAPVRFDADQNAVVFPNRWLNRALPGADPLLHRHFMKEADTLRMQHAAGLVEELRKALRNGMESHASSLNEVARQLGLHERTLNRRLKAEGTTFHHELEAVRYAVARHLLSESAMSLSEIAMALGYADASAFNRAFRRWSGVTPRQWSREHPAP